MLPGPLPLRLFDPFMMYNMIEPDFIHAVALGIHRCWRVSVFGIVYLFIIFLIF